MIAFKPQPNDASARTRGQAVREPSASRVVARPMPESQAQDPRGYQMEQLRKRFAPQEATADDGATSFLFKLRPSDPDFPFELAYLDCDLRVPEPYPEQRPELRVRNSNIPRGFGINIERGWQRLADERRDATLLALVHALDKNLESFLSEQKAETVKFVAFKDTRHLALRQTEEPTPATSEQPKPAPEKPPPSKPYMALESFTRDQVAAAKARRAQEVRQLEARMGRLPRFRRSADGVVFTVPIEPKRRSELCTGLRSVNSMHLIVPLLYPLQQLRIQLNEADAADADPVEELFADKAVEQKHMSLTSHVNYLVQNLVVLDKQAQASALEAEELIVPQPPQGAPVAAAPGPSGHATSEIKSHVKVIPRPPEWSVCHEGDESDESSSDTEEEDEPEGGVMLQDAEAALAENAKGNDGAQRGTMVTLPSVDLHGIELLQISILSISVKCGRCKTTNELTGLKPGADRMSSCSKCATPLGASFSPELVHAHSTLAGFVDVTGAKVADMLPSTFVPTCGRCSTASPGLVSVRGETVTNVCRECHAKFTFKVPEVKFLAVSPGPDPASVGPRQRRSDKKQLGLHAGEQLPDRGACRHYRKSYRWFRFSCCQRVHACDRCHDEAEDHANEWASRMICGWCSREQRFAVEACGFCGRAVVGRKGSGFWEGGKGTRDQRMMSRKDPRKHKRLGGSQAAASNK
ncbi:CHY zinc finger domain-containing protein [Hirsutella rhossiliensis]|uniref:CHY zinc finger domain-containing protein n=1 Tax=Hirsutella rhossiliensis TaxID=111463 RepID=A0A9P8MPB5_9HYPO|nr:CHY zinc finger domain-containing protein [Hirsutella rhossiliensis]KAH0958740.1 CHY zinc finger domain-containing protein [Hirsutella rhossiliensis]